jgi:hypothetical protein
MRKFSENQPGAVMVRGLGRAFVAFQVEPDTAINPKPSDRGPAQLSFFLTLATVIPLLVVISTHLWLRSAYTSQVFHLQGFLNQYSTGIYRYRILGPKLLLTIYRFLANHFRDQPFSMPTDAQATLLFYGSYAVLNAVLFFFSNLLLLLFLWDWKKGISDLHLACYFFLILVLTLSTYVVTPYDQLAYFLMFVGFLSVRLRTSWISYLVLAFAAVAGGINRETEFLVTPALLTVALFTPFQESKRYFRASLFNLVLFAACYVGVRVLWPGSATIVAGLTFGGKWPLESFVVVSALFYVGVSLVIREYAALKPSIVLLILSSPYIATILIGGEIRELRLLVPLLLCLFFAYIQLAQLKRAGVQPCEGSW